MRASTKIPKRMGETNQEEWRPHLLMVPFPSQGHIVPMFKLAKLLHHRGFQITFLNTEFNHRRFLQSLGVPTLEGLIPDFHFATIPDGFPASDDNATPHITDIIQAVRTTMAMSFRDFVQGLISPLTCIVVDTMLPFAFEVAQQLSIPTVQFMILAAGPALTLLSVQDLIENGLLPLKDGYLETAVNCIPGLEGLPLKYIPRTLLATDLSDHIFTGTQELYEKSIQGCSSAIIFNTFEDLESSFLKQLYSLYSKPILSIGPIHLLEKQVLHSDLYSFGASLWKEDPSCLRWLDAKPPNSVIYVSFGSVACLTAQHLKELAWGLAHSKYNFLWVIRPDLVRDNSESASLPVDFEMEVKDRAFLTSWCPQEKVIQHPAIGGFLTQSGWNSLLESICAGVPVLCLPDFGEQVTNTWLCSKKWGIGLEINKDNIKRGEVKRLIEELMSGEKGEKLKEKVMEWKVKTEEACSFGSSHANFESLVELLKTLHMSSV